MSPEGVNHHWPTPQRHRHTEKPNDNCTADDTRMRCVSTSGPDKFIGRPISSVEASAAPDMHAWSLISQNATVIQHNSVRSTCHGLTKTRPSFWHLTMRAFHILCPSKEPLRLKTSPLPSAKVIGFSRHHHGDATSKTHDHKLPKHEKMGQLNSTES